MERKTLPHDGSVKQFLDSVTGLNQKKDSERLIALMEEITGEPPVMWGPSIIGFGKYHYVYESGTEGDWFLCGFSPRKGKMTVYVMDGFKKHADILEKIGKHSHSVSCLYFKQLDDLDERLLKDLLIRSVQNIKIKYCA